MTSTNMVSACHWFSCRCEFISHVYIIGITWIAICLTNKCSGPADPIALIVLENIRTCMSMVRI